MLRANCDMGINKYRVVGEEKKRKKERKKEKNRTKDRTTRNRGMKNNVVIVYRGKIVGMRFNNRVTR